jgi:cytochrome c oxidase subunit II
MWNFPFFPDQASTAASRVDALYFTLVGVSLFFSLIIVVGLAYSAIRYRKGSKASRANALNDHLPLELAWSIIPLVIAFGLFFWGANLFFDLHVAPRNAIDIYVVGKQWMWKIQHPEGNREINELHVPVGKPVRLTMTSQDVIHSFFIPAFRIKQDVLPGRYTTEWFTATKKGEYHLFCAEYCGTSHSSMIGRVIVMDPAEYEAWLDDNAQQTMVTNGQQIFQQFGCQTCHRDADGPRGPSLTGLYGKTVTLTTGERVRADRDYIRESIVNPGRQLTAGYQALMPTFKSQVSEEQINHLIEYIKSLGGNHRASTKEPQ